MAGTMPDVIGFVGVGTINAAVIAGLCKTANPPRVVLSPRSQAKVAKLAEAFPSLVTVAKSNQAVVDRAKWVFVAVLPAQHAAVLGALEFTREHTVVSLMAGVPKAQLRAAITAAVPDENIARAVPLPPVKDHKGVTLVFPAHPVVVSLFDALGTAVAVQDEGALTTMMTMTYMMGPYYKLLQTCQTWLVEKGVEGTAASKYVGAIMHSIAADGKLVGEAGAGFDALIAEQTPGGFNEQGIRELTQAGVWDEYRATMSSLVQRTKGEAKSSEKRPATRNSTPNALALAVGVLLAGAAVAVALRRRRA